MFCAECGVRQPQGAKFCFRCGASTTAIDPNQPARQAPAVAQEVPEAPAIAGATAAMTGHGVGVSKQNHPWRRWCAHTLDIWTLGVPFAFGMFFVLGTLSHEFAMAVSTISDAQDRLMTTLLAYGGYIFIEAACLSSVGYTPFKYVYGIAVRDLSGQKLSFGAALARSAKRCVYAEAVGIPLIALFTQSNAYRALKNTGTTSYDKGLHTVTHRQWSPTRVFVVIAGSLLGVGIVVFYQVAMMSL